MIEKYYIYYGTDPNPATVMDSTINAEQSSKLITPLINGTTYYFRVGAVDTSKERQPAYVRSKCFSDQGCGVYR